MTLNSIKANTPVKKWARGPKQTFIQRRHIDGQQTHEKRLNITHYQRNANENYNELLPDTSQNDCHQKNPTINAGEGVERSESSCNVGGNVNWHSHFGVAIKLKTELPYDPAIPLLGIHPEKNMIQKDT